MKGWKKGICVILCVVLCGCQAPAPPPPEPVTPETVKGMWISFLELDAAFEAGDVTAAKEYIETAFSLCKKDGFNTVFFHVRAHGDAYYASQVFPLAKSVKLLLSKGFDPLAFAVETAGKQGLSLHAWVNPYRVGKEDNGVLTEETFEWDGNRYYIPTSEKAQSLILQGVRELVDHYAVDGVQFDDYFYPSGTPDTAMPFETVPKGVSVRQFREAAVNSLISAAFQVVHSKKGCLFGVSPAGKLTYNREKLYADPAKWLRYEGFVDYLCPQLYSGFENETLPFEREVEDWVSLPRREGVRLFGGLALYKVGEIDTFAGTGKEEWTKNGDILTRQAKILKEKGFSGVCLFRYGFWAGQKTGVKAAEISAFRSYIYNSDIY